MIKDNEKETLPPAAKRSVMRNPEIELWRFFFAVMVFLSHMNILPNGALAVDFFFLLTGYLTMNSISREKLRGNNVSGTSVFILRKISAFYPELLVATMTAIAIFLLSRPFDFHLIATAVKTLINGIVPLKMTGIAISYGDFNGATWYISSMLIGLIIVYPLLVRFGTHPMLFIAGVMICGFLCQYHGRLNGVYAWYGFTFEGNLRAVGEILIGATAYQAIQSFSQLNLSRLGLFFVTSIKYCCIGLIGIISVLHHAWLHGFVMSAGLLAIAISFSGQVTDRQLYTNKMCLFLGSLSLPLYLSHRAITVCANQLVPDFVVNIEWAKVMMCFIYSLALALVVMGTGKMIRKRSKKFIQLFITR